MTTHDDYRRCVVRPRNRFVGWLTRRPGGHRLDAIYLYGLPFGTAGGEQ